MASLVNIANAAAVAIGTDSRVTDITEDRVLARSINAVLDIQRQAAIRDGFWNFAMTRKELPALSAPPEHGFNYAFQLPADCLRLIEVFGVGRADYQLEGRQILSDCAGPIFVRFVKDVPEPELWDSSFADAFALRLAWRVGKKIGGSTFSKDAAWQEYRDALAKAKFSDATENPPIAMEQDSWTDARLGGAFYGQSMDAYR